MKKLFFIALCLTQTACNLHEVDPGKFFRSGQMSRGELKQTIEKLKIKTVINLRGANPEKDWYKEEKSVTEELGVVLIDIKMGASRLPHRSDLIKLLDTFHDAERPILVHCQGGADRTGEASAIYKMEYMGATKKEALEMLTSKYFHLESKKPAKRYFIRELWQGESWARNEYHPCSGLYKYYDDQSEECSGNNQNPEDPGDDS